MKRVIGLPGDTIEVRGGVVILNGEAAAATARIADYRDADQPQQPVPRRDRRRRARGSPAPDGGELCAYPRFRETLPGRRSYDVLDQMATARATRSGRSRCPRTISS